MDKRLTVIRYIAYSAEILILYILQGTPGLVPELFGGRPVLLICAALTIAAFEEELPAMFFGVACGVMCDLGTGAGIGFFAITLTALCFIEAQLFKSVIVRNFINSIGLCLGGCALSIGLYFVFFYLLKGYDGAGYYFVSHYISRIIYTFLCCIPVYFLNMLLHTRLRARGGEGNCRRKKKKRKRRRMKKA